MAMRAVLVCSACGSAVVLGRSKYGDPTENGLQIESPSHCSNLNCPNRGKRTKLSRDWYRSAAWDSRRPD